MDGARIEGELNADSLRVGGHLFMRATEQNKATFKGVSLLNAKVSGAVEMIGAAFEGELDADSSEIGGHLRLDAPEKKAPASRA